MNCETKNISFDKIENQKFITNVSLNESISENAQILYTYANAASGRCEVLNNEVIIEGIVRFTVIYTEEGEIKKLMRTERFGINQSFDGVLPKTKVLACANAKDVRSRIEVGTLMLDATVEVCAKAIITTEAEICDSVNDSHLVKKSKSVNFSSVNYASPLRFTVAGESSISPRLPYINNILSISAFPNVTECKISASQLIIGGNIFVQATYQSDDADDILYQISDNIEFTQIMDVDAENGNCSVNLSLEDVAAELKSDENGEHNLIDYSFMLCGNVISTVDSQIEIVSDVYSTQNSLELKQNNVYAAQIVQDSLIANSQRYSVNLPAGKVPISRIVSVNFVPGVCQFSVENGQARIEGTAQISAIYLQSGTNQLDGFNTSIPICLNFDVNFDNTTNASANISLIEMQAVLVSGTELEIRATMGAKLLMENIESCKVISEINVGAKRDCDQYGLIIYYASASESLWDICKRYAVTEENLREFNPDLGETLSKGDKVYIFRQSIAE